jgi:oligosaccharide repeat unit polymerase
MRFDPTLIPSPSRFTAGFLFLAIIAGLFEFVTADQSPLIHPFAALVASTAVLAMFGDGRPALASFMRAGFHLGFFAFFLSIPLFDTEAISARIDGATVEIVGWMLILSVIGFEMGYWWFTSGRRSGVEIVTDPAPDAKTQKNLVNFLILGVLAWLIFVADQVTAFQVPATTLLLTMRGRIEGAAVDPDPVLGYYAGMVVVSGIYLAAASAVVLITRSRRAGPVVLTLCWIVLVLTAAVGFLRGSRAVFFYAMTPLIVAIWSVVSERRGLRSFRWMWLASAAVVIIVSWGAMSAMRGGDIRNYEGGWSAINPEQHLSGAFNIYDSLAEVVEGFPEKIPYQNGKSLLALVLGWVPRPVWPDKPYPFSLHLTRLRGETLTARSASIASGLPGEGYGNFGYFGVILWAGLLGFAARKGDDAIHGLHIGQPLKIQIGATAAIWTAMIVRGGVPEMFYMGLFIIMFPALLALYLRRAQRSVEAAVDPGRGQPSRGPL